MAYTNNLVSALTDRRRIQVLIAAALSALVVVGTVFALTRNSSTTVDAADSSGSPAGATPAAASDASDTGEIDDAPAVTTPTAGSVWVYITGDDLPRPLLTLGDNATPFDGQFWIKPLIATGGVGSHVEQTYLEFDGLGEPNVWLPASTIEQVADGRSPIEPAEVLVPGVEAGRILPGLGVAQTEPIVAGTPLTSTGLRSEVDGVTWLLIMAEFPFFVPEDSVTPASGDTTDQAGDQAATQAGDQAVTQVTAERRCYSDGAVAIVLDANPNTGVNTGDGVGTVTGWQIPLGFAAEADGLSDDQFHTAPNGNLLLTVAGTATDLQANAYRVSELSVAAISNGFSIVSTSQWTIDDNAVVQPGVADDLRLPAIDCDAVAADLAPVESNAGIYPPDLPTGPTITVDIETSPGQNRVCYDLGRGPVGDAVLVVDFSDDGLVANGLNATALETISATKTFDGDNTYSVAMLVLGDAENGRDTVTTVQWEITPERINLPFDGEEVPAVDCATVADSVAQAERTLANAPYPTYPLGS
jgi:hypothetical protein